MIIDQEPDIEKFNRKLPEIGEVYCQAFAGFPWFEELSLDEVFLRLEDNRQKPGFQALLAALPTKEIVGGLWFDTPSLDQLEMARGSALRDFAEEWLTLNGSIDLIWEREVIVKPSFQGRGIATGLRTNFMGYLNTNLPNGLVLTRMREDNIPILTIAGKLGFQKTGIQKVSSQDPNIYHDYWFKAIGAKR